MLIDNANILRQKRKTLKITISNDGQLTIFAPLKLSYVKIEELLKSKENLLNKKIAKKREFATKNKEILSIGKATLTNKGLTFKGYLNNENVDFTFDAKSIYSMTLSTKGYLEFYSKNNYYMLIPNNSNQNLIKWTLASEEIHNLYDEKWQAACKDVYDYDKGDIYE